MYRNGNPTNVVVVGAGPAGIAAATMLDTYGVRTTLIDEAHSVGGQYYKHYSAAPSVKRGRELDSLYKQGRHHATRLQRSNVEVRTGTTVWGIFEPNKLALMADDQVEILEPSTILLANGAIERVAAFPGWTLPGVMTAGGAQRLLSHEGVLPGSRFVLAGTGPLLLAIATQIAEAGGDVAAVVDCTPLTAPVRSARTIRGTLGQPGRFVEWVRYRARLRQMGIPYLHRHTVLDAGGQGSLENVRVARVDRNWRPIAGTDKVIEADTLCLHYGFAASTELAQVIGCDLDFDPARGGWYVHHDDGMRTSQKGVYVAGQLSGIGGADLAESTGELAALTICSDHGLLSPETYEERSKPVQSNVARGRRFADMLNLAYTPGNGIGHLITPDTLVCRCEEVDAGQIDEAVGAGASTLNDVKRHTRCGMGFCQGRICSQMLGTYLAQRHGIAPKNAGLFNARIPLKPIPLGVLATIPEPEKTPSEF